MLALLLSSTCLAAVLQDGTLVPLSSGAVEILRKPRPALREDPGIRFSPDGTRLALGSPGGRLSIRDFHDSKTVDLSQEYPEASLSSVAFAPDGTWIAASLNHGSGRSNVVVWTVANGQSRILLPGPRDLYQLEVSPDGSVLAAVDREGVTIARMPDGAKIGRIPGIGVIRFRSDGRSLVLAGLDGKITLWSTVENPVILHETPALQGIARVHDIAPGGGLVLESTAEGGLLLRGWVAGKPLALATGERALRGAFSGDGRLLAAAFRDHSLRLWESASGRELGRIEAPNGETAGLALSPDGRDAVIQLRDGGVHRIHWKDAVLRRGPAAADLDTLCGRLTGSNAGEAWEALWSLAEKGDEAVGELDHRLGPSPSAAEIQDLLSRLEKGPEGAQEAATALRRLGADPVIVDTPKKNAAADAIRRLEEVFGEPILAEKSIQDARLIQALELIATPRARTRLQQLSEGAPGLTRTVQAREALRRLSLKYP